MAMKWSTLISNSVYSRNLKYGLHVVIERIIGGPRDLIGLAIFMHWQN